MDKVKSVLNKVLSWAKKAPVVKAFGIWIVLLIVLAFAVATKLFLILTT